MRGEVIDVFSWFRNNIGSVNTPGNAKVVTLSPNETKAYVADWASGLQIIDLTGLEQMGTLCDALSFP